VFPGFPRKMHILHCDGACNICPAGFVPAGLVSGCYHNCAIRIDRSLVCWGYNLYGQLGIGNVTNIGTSQGQMGNNLQTVNLGSGQRDEMCSPFSNIYNGSDKLHNVPNKVCDDGQCHCSFQLNDL
jgi:hypothetical protein